MTVIDLFAGPGGWDIGARAAGIHTIGIEHDATACATRAAAQLATIRADLYHYPPRPCEGLIASPPCPAFSTAGKRTGHDDIESLQALLAQPTIGHTDRQQWSDPSSELIAQTARWAHLATDWVALEQVPPVLPIWRALAEGLRSAGWQSAWAGVLNSADYGVPQTRKRAILIASRTRTVRSPAPTHDADPHPTLFGEPLKPWVSMAEALGWDGKVGFPGRNDRGDSPDGYRERDWVATDGPAQTVTAKARSWVNTGRDWEKGGTRDDAQKVPCSAPAPALTAASGGQWVFTRPATTVCCDPRVPPPGHRDRAGGERQYGEGTVKIEPWEAGVLQSFPDDYPWQGTRTAQFAQIGNAVPPLLAQRILESLSSTPAKNGTGT